MRKSTCVHPKCSHVKRDLFLLWHTRNKKRSVKTEIVFVPALMKKCWWISSSVIIFYAKRFSTVDSKSPSKDQNRENPMLKNVTLDGHNHCYEERDSLET